MNGSFPPSLQNSDPNPNRDDLHILIEEVIRQNAEILERLDDWDDEDDEEIVQTIEYQKPVIVQLFETVFSWETVCIVLVIALLVIPLLRTALH